MASHAKGLQHVTQEIGGLSSRDIEALGGEPDTVASRPRRGLKANAMEVGVNAAAWWELQWLQAPAWLVRGTEGASTPDVSDITSAWSLPAPNPMSAKSCWAHAAAVPIFKAKTSNTSTAKRAEARRRASNRRETAGGIRIPYTLPGLL